MSKQLLVIDDEPKITEALSEWFSSRGFSVSTAATVQAALTHVHRTSTDIVLLDLRLPDGSGMELLSQIKTQFPNLRVVVMSGLSDVKTIQEAMQRGASGYMTKPFDFTRCFYTAMGLEMVDVSTVRPDPAVLARVPVEIARRHRVLPVRVAAEGLVLAMADPLDEEELVELRKRLDCSIVPLAPIGASIDEAIERCYGSIEQSVEQAANGEQLFKALVMEAASRHATHLHVGVDPTGPWVRHRIDGLLANATAPTELTARYGAVLSALRRLAQIRSGSELPQQGSLSYPVGGTTLDLHVVIFQTRYGEHAFIRMVDPAQRLPLSGLGLTPEQQRLFEPMLAKPAGLCLLAAPGRSGRRTTLYASLSHLIHASQGARRIVTLEQYIETDIPGITQIQVRPEVGLTFAQGIRLALEHDPDVLVVGELGDQETALLAVQAALSGCLVLSTVPTLDAARGIMRLLDWGIEPFLLCSALVGVISQRLVRKLCPACKAAVSLDAGELAGIGMLLPLRVGPVKLWQAVGCEHCRYTGYHGRSAIFELLPIDPHMKALMLKQTPAAQLRQSAIARGMSSLWGSGWRLLQSGVTSLQEMAIAVPPELR